MTCSICSHNIDVCSEKISLQYSSAYCFVDQVHCHLPTRKMRKLINGQLRRLAKFPFLMTRWAQLGVF